MFSVELIADILSLPKRTVEARINRGEIKICVETGKIPLDSVMNYPQIQEMLNSKWDLEAKIKPLQNYKSVELFAGGGGLALGLERAGFDTIFLNEIDKHACNTLRHNRPNWNVVEGDISGIDFNIDNDDIDLLTGGFPCQAFSYAGNSLGFEDTRGTLVFEMARAIKTLQPKIFMAENVKALQTHDKGKTLKVIKGVMQEIGYTLIEPKVLKAIFYKVPQKRERLIIIGIRNDLSNFIDNFNWPSVYNKIMTVQDAFYKGELYDTDVPLSPWQNYPQRKKEIMDKVPQGGYWRDLPIELQKEYMQKSFYLGGGKTGMARRLSLNEPSLTLTCAPAQKQTERCHPLETRPLSAREYARIQTFPDDWEFQGSITNIYKQIGNAVPVNLAEALGRSIINLLNKIKETEVKSE